MNDMSGLIAAQIELVSGTVLPYTATRTDLKNLIHAITLWKTGRRDSQTMTMVQIKLEDHTQYVFVVDIIRVITPAPLS